MPTNKAECLQGYILLLCIARGHWEKKSSLKVSMSVERMKVNGTAKIHSHQGQEREL